MSNVYKTNYGFDVSVEIIRDAQTDNARIKVIAPMYMNKEWFMSHSYKASEYSDHEILRDRSFTTTMIEHYPTLQRIENCLLSSEKKGIMSLYLTGSKINDTIRIEK